MHKDVKRCNGPKRALFYTLFQTPALDRFMMLFTEMSSDSKQSLHFTSIPSHCIFFIFLKQVFNSCTSIFQTKKCILLMKSAFPGSEVLNFEKQLLNGSYHFLTPMIFIQNSKDYYTGAPFAASLNVLDNYPPRQTYKIFFCDLNVSARKDSNKKAERCALLLL